MSDGARFGGAIYMHREILQPPAGMVTDHIIGERADNQRGNLRVLTPRENSQHRVKQQPRAGRYKGVHKKGNRWRAFISNQARGLRYLGSFITDTEAALAYNRAATKQYGYLAVLNVIDDVAGEA